MSNQEIARKALALPLMDRVELAQALWQSIGEASASGVSTDERETLDEAKRRNLELTSGAVAGRTHEQVMEAANRALRCG